MYSFIDLKILIIDDKIKINIQIFFTKKKNVIITTKNLQKENRVFI